MAALGPELLLMGGAALLLLWAGWGRSSMQRQRAVGLTAMALTFAVGVYVVWSLYQVRSATGGPIAVDNFRWLADVVILLGTLFALALTIDDNARQQLATAESHVLILFSSSGMMLLAAAQDLMIVFLGIEIMSIAVYCLAGINRRSARGAEASLKYFLLGAFATGFLLYGMALVYGATGTTNLADIAVRVSELNLGHSPLLLIGIAILFIGFGFKTASVPFHMWTPDVYDGSPPSITAYMAATVKAAAFAALLRVWMEAFPGEFRVWQPIIAGIAIATMIVGNVVGLAQKNVVRMLAYSSIAHAGYLLIALAAASSQSGSTVLFYLLVYTLTTFGAFGIIIVLARGTDRPVMMEDFTGLWAVRPWLALGMGFLMFSFLGLPMFGGAGFFAKWYILQAALQAPVPQTTLAVVLVLTTVVSAGYYLYVVMVMFMKPRPEGAAVPAPAPMLTRAVVVISVVTVLLLGIVPEQVVRLARAGAMKPVATVQAAPATVGAVDQ
jgi:NADH-quinone oxidoreductase subunit N